MAVLKKKKTSKSTKDKSDRFWNRHRRLLQWTGGSIGLLAVLVITVYVAFQVSPWPNALLIRKEFNKGGAEVSKALEKYVPANIAQVENQQYKEGDKDALLDVFYPEKTSSPRPTIVWVHGGGWVSGNKDEVDNYMKIVAGQGFTTVSVNYSIAPEKQYPTPIVQLNEALEYIQRNAGQLNIDDRRIILAGDSAGSQIAAQMANIITSPSYADEIGIQPKLAASNLRAVLLNCGAYDLALPNYSGEFGSFLHTVLWAYSGTKDFLNDPKLRTASVVNYITPAFPPSYITAGNVDPLLSQSTELAEKLKSMGVVTSPLFYDPHHKPELNHEYQFDLDTEDGQKALRQMIDFARMQSQ